MPVCPVCGQKFPKEGRCPICGEILVESVSESPPRTHKAAVYIDDEPAFLASGSSSIDCGLIEGSLTTAGIPFLKKDRDIGGYMRVYMGYSVFGCDYYVPSKLLKKAKETLDASSVPGGWGATGDDAGEVKNEAPPQLSADPIDWPLPKRTAAAFTIAALAFMFFYIAYLLLRFLG